MVNIDRYFDELDRLRLERARELSDVKAQFTKVSQADPYSIRAKAAIVLSYAHWEGFYQPVEEVMSRAHRF